MQPPAQQDEAARLRARATAIRIRARAAAANQGTTLTPLVYEQGLVEGPPVPPEFKYPGSHEAYEGVKRSAEAKLPTGYLDASQRATGSAIDSMIGIPGQGATYQRIRAAADKAREIEETRLGDAIRGGQLLPGNIPLGRRQVVTGIKSPDGQGRKLDQPKPSILTQGEAQAEQPSDWYPAGDGSFSTLLTKSFGTDKGEVLLPTISDDGRLMSDEEAFNTFLKTGRHLGIYKDVESATAAAKAISQKQGMRAANLKEWREREYASLRNPIINFNRPTLEDIELAAKSDPNIAKVLAEARGLQAIRNRELEMTPEQALIASFYTDEVEAAERSFERGRGRRRPTPLPRKVTDQDVADIVIDSLMQAEGGFDQRVDRTKWFSTPFGDFTAGTAKSTINAATAMTGVAGAASRLAAAVPLLGRAGALGLASGLTTGAIQGARVGTGAQESVDIGQIIIDGVLGNVSGRLGNVAERFFGNRTLRALGNSDVARSALLGVAANRTLTEAEKAIIARLQAIRIAAKASGDRASDVGLNVLQLLDEQQKIARGQLPDRPWIDRIAEFLGGYTGSVAGRATGADRSQLPRPKPTEKPKAQQIHGQGTAWGSPTRSAAAPDHTLGISGENVGKPAPHETSGAPPKDPTKPGFYVDADGKVTPQGDRTEVPADHLSKPDLESSPTGLSDAMNWSREAISQLSVDEVLKMIQLEMVRDAASRPGPYDDPTRALVGDPNRAALDSDLAKRVESNRAALALQAKIDEAVVARRKGIRKGEMQREHALKQAIRKDATERAAQARAEADAAELAARPRTEGKPVKLEPQQLTTDQWRRVSERLNMIERVQGTPATPEQFAIVQAMIVGDKPGLERSLPPKVGPRPKTPAQMDQAAADILARSAADLGGKFGHFDRAARVAARDARLKPRPDAPEMVVRQAVEVGDRAYFDNGGTLAPLTPEIRNIIRDGIERGDIAVSSPRMARSQTPEAGKQKPKAQAKGVAADPTAYRMEAQLTGKDGQSRKVVVYSDTPSGDWAQIRDILRQKAKQDAEAARESGPKKLYAGIPFDAFFDLDPGLARSRVIDPNDARLKRVLEAAAGNYAWRRNVGGRVRDAMVKGLGKVLRRPGMAKNFYDFFGGVERTASTTGISGRALERLAPLRISFSQAIGEWNRVVMEVVGGDPELSGKLHAAVFDILETHGRDVPPEAAMFSKEQLAKGLEAGKKLGEEMLKIGRAVEDLGHLPSAVFELTQDGELTGEVYYVFKDGTLKHGVTGSKPNPVDPSSPYKKMDGAESIRAFESDTSLEPGQAWKMVGGVEYYGRQGSWLKHMSAGAQLAESFGPIGTQFKRLWDGLFDRQTRKYFSRRTELDISGKTSEYERSLRPTISTGLGELKFLGTAFMLDESERAGVLLPEAKLKDTKVAAELGKQIEQTKAGLAKAKLDLELAREAWAAEKRRIVAGGTKRADIDATKHPSFTDAILLADQAVKAGKATLDELRARFESRRVGGTDNAGFEILKGPRWGKYEGWYLDRGVLHEIQSEGLQRKHWVWRLLNVPENMIKIAKSLVGTPTRLFAEGFSNMRHFQQRGVRMLTGEGAEADAREALSAAMTRVNPGETHNSASWREFEFLMEDSSLGGAASIENMDTQALRQAQRDMQLALQSGNVPDKVASFAELGMQLLQHTIMNAKMPGVDIGKISRFAQHVSDTYVGYYAFLRMKRHGVEGSAPLSSVDAARYVKEGMDMRDVTRFVRAITSVPLLRAFFFRYRAKLLEGSTKSLGLPVSLYGKRIPMPYLDSVILDDPTSGKAALAVSVRAAARMIAKFVEVAAPVMIYRGMMLEAYGDEYAKKYKEGVEAMFRHLPAPIAAAMEAITVPLGEDGWGDPRVFTLDFLAPNSAVATYFYNTGMSQPDANRDRLFGKLFQYNPFSSAIYQTMENVDYKGWKRGKDSVRAAPLLQAFAPGFLASAWAEYEQARDDPLGRAEPIKELAYALLGMRVRVAGTLDADKAALEQFYKQGYIDYIEYPSGGRKPINVVDPSESDKATELFLQIKMMLQIYESHPDTFKQLMRKIANEQDNILRNSLR